VLLAQPGQIEILVPFEVPLVRLAGLVRPDQPMLPAHLEVQLSPLALLALFAVQLAVRNGSQMISVLTIPIDISEAVAL
jgi:hypothetical protein